MSLHLAHPAQHAPARPAGPPPALGDPRSAAGSPDLVDFLDFRTLMAAEGHDVDLQRLREDRAYARGCFAMAASSGSELLRHAAQRLLRGGRGAPVALG